MKLKVCAILNGKSEVFSLLCGWRVEGWQIRARVTT